MVYFDNFFWFLSNFEFHPDMHVFKLEVKSELLWLPFKAIGSVQNLVSAAGGYATSLCSGGEDRHTHMLLVLD